MPSENKYLLYSLVDVSHLGASVRITHAYLCVSYLVSPDPATCAYAQNFGFVVAKFVSERLRGDLGGASRVLSSRQVRSLYPGERMLDRLWWGLIPHWCNDSEGGRKPINVKAETVAVYHFQTREDFVTPLNSTAFIKSRYCVRAWLPSPHASRRSSTCAASQQCVCGDYPTS